MKKNNYLEKIARLNSLKNDALSRQDAKEYVRSLNELGINDVEDPELVSRYFADKEYNRLFMRKNQRTTPKKIRERYLELLRVAREYSVSMDISKDIQFKKQCLEKIMGYEYLETKNPEGKILLENASDYKIGMAYKNNLTQAKKYDSKMNSKKKNDYGSKKNSKKENEYDYGSKKNLKKENEYS